MAPSDHSRIWCSRIGGSNLKRAHLQARGQGQGIRRYVDNEIVIVHPDGHSYNSEGHECSQQDHCPQLLPDTDSHLDVLPHRRLIPLLELAILSAPATRDISEQWA